jgi:hypothetical protein
MIIQAVNRRFICTAFVVLFGVSCSDDLMAKNDMEAPMKSITENAKRRVIFVDKITKNGVRYEELRGGVSRGFEQNGGILLATDVATNKELWVLQIYKTEYDPQEEADVQDVYFTKLKASWFSNSLTIVNERNETYEVKLKDRQILKK